MAGTKPPLGSNGIDVDQMLPHIGEFGKFQIALEAMLCITIIPQTLQILLMYFAAHNPPWECVPNSLSCTKNGTFSSSSKDYTFRCNIPRTEWRFTKPSDYSIVTQYDIYCDNEYYIYLTTSLFFIGWAIGAVTLGWIADRFGRKIVLFPSMAVIMITGFISAFLPVYWPFLLSRVIVGFFTPGTGVQMFVMASEFAGTKYRPLAGIILWLFFSIGLVIVGVKAIFIKQWKILLIVCTAPYIGVLFFAKFVPESARWLRVRGRTDEAMAILRRIANFNGKVMPDSIYLSKPPEKDEHTRKVSPMDLFRTKKMALKSVIQAYAWMVNGMVYYGVALAADDLGGSMYRDYILASIIEFPAVVAAIVFCNKFGRKKTVIIPMFVGSVACIVVSLIPSDGPSHWKVLRVILGMIGKFSITVSFDSIYTWSVELYPTMIRAQGMGLLQITSRIGAALAPWVAKWLNVVHIILPFALMGGATLLSAFTLLYLPETKGKVTAETLEEEEKDLEVKYSKEMNPMAEVNLGFSSSEESTKL